MAGVTPIERLFAAADMRCTRCGAPAGSPPRRVPGVDGLPLPLVRRMAPRAQREARALLEAPQMT
jgi:hypothetical protein